MKPTGPQIALALSEWAQLRRGASAPNDAIARSAALSAEQLAQAILDQPNTKRLHGLGLTMLGIERLPDEQWTLPVPSVSVATASVTAAVAGINESWSRTLLHRLVAARTLAWEATQLARALELHMKQVHDSRVANNGGNTAGMTYPPVGESTSSTTEKSQ
jgi:hypothetical protein